MIDLTKKPCFCYTAYYGGKKVCSNYATIDQCLSVAEYDYDHTTTSFLSISYDNTVVVTKAQFHAWLEHDYFPQSSLLARRSFVPATVGSGG